MQRTSAKMLCGHYFNLFRAELQVACSERPSNLLPGVDRSRDHCYQGRCPLQNRISNFHRILVS